MQQRVSFLLLFLQQLYMDHQAAAGDQSIGNMACKRGIPITIHEWAADRSNKSTRLHAWEAWCALH
jgi:hypothetical protein